MVAKKRGSIEIIGLWIAFIGLIITVLALLQAMLASNQDNNFQETQIAMFGAILTGDSSIQTLNALTPASSSTETAISIQATALGGTQESYETAIASLVPSSTPTEAWTLGRQLYSLDFDDQRSGGLNVISGNFEIFGEGDNYIWRTSSEGSSQIALGSGIRLYAVEFNIRQVAGSKGLVGVYLSEVTNNCPGYQIYMNTNSDKILLTKKNLSCQEALVEADDHVSFPLLNNTWYKFRVEVKNNEIRVYLDDVLIIQNTSMDNDLLTINKIGFWTCCENLLPYTFDFDDIQVSLINPK